MVDFMQWRRRFKKSRREQGH